MSTTRYPGVRAFCDDAIDSRLFFGREEETFELLNQLLSCNLLVLFGKSGVGKTSMIHAGLMGHLEQRDYLPLPIRFNQDPPPEDPVRYVIAQVTDLCETKKIDYRPGSSMSLWEYFKTAVFWREQRLLTPVLILDQFEEVFSLHHKKFRHALAIEIGLLTGNRLPEYLRAHLQEENRLPFSETPPEMKLLIGIREDCVGELQALTPEIPAILQNRFRLTGLRRENATRAVAEPASLHLEGVTFSTRAFHYQPEAINDILNYAQAEDDTIAPLILQIQCSHVEEEVRKRQAADTFPLEVDKTSLGGSEAMHQMMAAFYKNAIKDISPHSQRRLARKLCEEWLVTNTGNRRSALEEDIIHLLGVKPEVLQQLANSHLLCKGSTHLRPSYEIAHDRLAEAVYQSRPWRMPKKVMATGIGIIIALILCTSLLIAQQSRINAQNAEIQKQHANAKAQLEQDRAQQLLSFIIIGKGDDIKKLSRSTLDDIERKAETLYGTPNDSDIPLPIRRILNFFNNDRGDRAYADGKLDEAADFYRKFHDNAETLSKNNPGNAELMRDHALADRNLGDILVSKIKAKNGKDYGEAIKCYQSGEKILTILVSANPADSTSWKHLAVTLQSCAQAHELQGDTKAARQCYQKAKEALEKVPVRDRPDNFQTIIDFLSAQLKKSTSPPVKTP